MKIKINFLVKILTISISCLYFTGCESNINKNPDNILNNQTSNTSKTESLVDNNIRYIEIGNNKKIPFLEKENIEILDAKVTPPYEYELKNINLDIKEDFPYTPGFKNIKIQFINNSNVELKNVEFKYEFDYKQDSSTTLYIPTSSKEIATANIIGPGFYVSESLNNFDDYVNNIKDYITAIRYEISKDNMTVEIAYEYKTGIYSIDTREETADRIYYNYYTYYPTEDKIVLKYGFDSEISNTEDYDSLESNKKDTVQNKYSNEEIKTNSNNKLNIYSVKHGELLDVYQDEGLVIIKTKIDYAYSKKSTINQNGFNIEHIIEDNNMENIDEIQYWAVADMGNGYDEKVVSFTMDKNLINKVKNGSVAGAYIVDEASDVWIHTSLR